MWRGRFPQSLARTQFSPAQGAAFQRAGSLRPGQAGAILIGAVRPAHVAATFADLAGQGLLRYEKTLLRRLFRRADHVLLSQLSGTSAAAIRKVYAQLSRVLGARLSPADPDMGGPAGQDQDDTRAILRAFRGHQTG